MCLRIALALPLIAVVAGGVACSAFQRPESGFVVSIEDPSGRLGTPPWTLAIFNPYLGPEQRLAMQFSGTVAPGRPLELLSRRQEDDWRMSDPLSEDDIQFGLVLPALRSDGYWLARVRREGISFSGTGTATFCRWQHIVPEADSETLAVTIRHREANEGLQLETVVRIPPAPPNRVR